MKKIIYNTKMKKIIITMLLVMVIFQFLMPNFVFALDLPEGTERKWYEDWIAYIDAADITDNKKEKIKEQLKNYVVDMMLKTGCLGSTNGHSYDYYAVAEVYLSQPNCVIVYGIPKTGALSGKLKSIEFVTFALIETENDDENENENDNGNGDGNKEENVDGNTDLRVMETMTYQELLEWVGCTEEELNQKIIPKIQLYYNIPSGSYYEGGITTEEVAENILKDNKDTILMTVSGTKESYEIIKVEIPGKDVNTVLQETYDSMGMLKEDEGDLGGILLAPVFMLINFANDAIIHNLCDIMIGDGIEGWQVLTGQVLFAGVGNILSDTKKVPATEDLSNAVTVNVGSFTFGYQYPNIPYTPEEIFSGKVDLFSIDFISGKLPKRDANGEFVKDEKGNVVYETNPDEDWMNIRSVIASWYKVLRMIAIIGLLSVLIYTGIKIMLSANAKDKAKYKEWIMNWFIAVAILFSMHYIMSFINAIITEINVLLDDACQEIIVRVEGGVDGKLAKDESEYFATNLMGLVRFMIQSGKFSIKVGYEVMYIALLVYTIKFTVVYLKRVLNMAFLTLIAPIVALTYPIDKLNDGRAQGFDMWLKEYIFNALLQPMHYIMYYILMGASATIAASNPIYGIVVLMFMSEAEKLLKKIFGFDKASGGTVGGMSGAFAAGAVASSVAKIATSLSKGKGGNGSGGRGDSKPEAIDSPKPTEKPDFAETFDEGEVGGSYGGNSERVGAEEVDNVPEEYRNEGYGQNAEGHYFNPWTDEYDEDYNPAEDSAYKTNEPQEESAQESIADSEPVSQLEPASEPESQPEPQQSSTPIRDMAKSVVGGTWGVVKHIAKPIWDFDKSGKYNGSRLVRKIGKGALKGVAGFALGTAAAAVQAGISITDGKYNPMEGIATFSAGFAGGGRVADSVVGVGGTLVDAYKEGAGAGNKQAQMKRAQSRFADRDDVIAFNKKEYAGKEKEYMQRERDNYLTAGVTDLKDMKRCMKYADSMVKTEGLTAEQIEQARKKADAKAAATLDFRKTLQEQGQMSVVYDQKKQKAYIDEMVKQAERNGGDGTRTRRQYENAFKSIVAYDAANR